MALFATTASAGVLMLRSNVRAAGESILLSELAALPSALPDDWKARTVLPAPAPGTTQTYPLLTIARSLQEFPDMQHVVLRGPVDLEVTREKSKLEFQRVIDAIEAFVASRPEWSDRDVVVECTRPEGLDELPPAATPPAVSSYSSLDEADSYSFVVDIHRTDGEPISLSVPTTTRELPKTWIAAKDLTRGHTLEIEDLRLAAIAPGPGNRGISGDEFIVGMELNRRVRAGQPILSHFVLPPLCAKRGELINVTVSNGSLEVALQARAMANGRMDERIYCMNEKSKRRIYVRLTAPKCGSVDI